MIQIGVIGAGSCDTELRRTAEEVGAEIAKNNAIMLCGGLGGVMEAAAFGAKKQGGTTIGILPGNSRQSANPCIDIAIVTDMGHARNVIIAQSSDALIAVGGEYGTLSEIAHSLKMGKTVVILDSKWEIEGTIKAKNSKDAVRIAIDSIKVK
ncbi:TIGR00725 family protein [Methanolobus mangrovi]|uniref:TIGR00725 family protein n=1 Tax=Methanolobus mangrovi TaxID=3072977 RepID=A0AA51UHK2_9EURY|nr:TIGR00725 family protein [Methanolobus mangrovi]WMW23325.1 TIGR00725 family protein [Methanolobus mangrovi]